MKSKCLAYEYVYVQHGVNLVLIDDSRQHFATINLA